MEQYYKPFPVCRWAQPPVQAVLYLMLAHGLKSTDVAQIEIVTFHQSLRLATRTPAITEEAQYSTAFPAAVAAVRGTIGAADISGAAFADQEICHLAEGMHVSESDSYNAALPMRLWSCRTARACNPNQLRRVATPRRWLPAKRCARNSTPAPIRCWAEPSPWLCAKQPRFLPSASPPNRC
jgi:hypothetical protein